VAGCNALTGVGDLEEVPCTSDCVEDASVDSVVEDTRVETASEDSADTEIDTAIDVVVDTFMPCTSDGKCDDMDACTRDTCDLDSGVCASTKIDDDMDGQSPSALGACGTDCNDTNKDVFDKQVAFFAVPYLDGAGASSYDYDCNGVEEKEKTATYKCLLTAPTKCTLTEGWTTAPPACGALGSYVSACVANPFGSGCTPSTTKTRQRCR
jgi:hypothetical protein